MPTLPNQVDVRADALKSVLDSYVVLKETWDEALEAVKSTESKARILGVSAQMQTFKFFLRCSSW